MKRMGKWVVWILVAEFVLAFAIGTKIRRDFEKPRIHFVQEAPQPQHRA